VDRSSSVGTNLLIRDGAFPVLGPDDLAEVLRLLAVVYGPGTVVRDSGECDAYNARSGRVRAAPRDAVKTSRRISCV